MLKKYLKAVEWNIRNVAIMTKKDWADFGQLDDQFNAWVKTLPVADQDAAAAQIKAVSAALTIFHEAKIVDRFPV